MDTQSYIIQNLHQEFAARRERNSAYSLRAFARFLGIQPSGLSDIFSGKRKVSRKMGAKFCAKLKVPETIALEFLKPKKNTAVNGSQVYTKLNLDTFGLIYEWHYLAILTLSELDDFNGEASWIATRLGISKKKAAEALHRLSRLGLLQPCNGPRRLQPTKTAITVGKEIPDTAIQRSHQEHFELASQAISKISVLERDFSFVNIATDQEHLKIAKEKIKRFRRELVAFLESSDTKNRVFRLGIQIFPLSTSNTLKKEN